MYKYKNIGFRPIDENDLEILRINRNDSETLLFLGSVDLVSSEQQKEWWKSLSRSKTQLWFCVFEEKYANVVGVLRFQNIDYINKCCEIGADIFPEFRGRGLGIDVYEMALEYLFCHFNINTVYLRVAEFNKRGIDLYKKIGFKETGYIPESIFRDNKYWQTKFFSFIRSDYKRE